MKHIGLAGGPSVSHPFSLDFRVFIYKRRHWSSSSALPSQSASWEEDEKRTPVGKKGIGKVLGKRESLAGPGTWTEPSVMDEQWGQKNRS